jgi:hypothetical protein
MAKLKPGDRVDCRVKLNAIVSPYNPDYDEVVTFEVVAKDKPGYYLYVPCYILLKGSVLADKHLVKRLKINPRFLGERVMYIQESMILKVSSVLDGLFCAKCHEFFMMSEPNQEDGTLICWSCRQNPYR